MGSIYRPPGSPIDEFTADLNSCLTKLSSHNNRLYLAGDFNINLLRSNDHQPTSAFINLMTSHKLLPSILRPTRITENTATLIDNIFTNSLAVCQDSCICISDISDHLPIFLYVDLQPPYMKIPLTTTCRNFDSLSKTKFVSLLQDTDWSPIETLCANGNPTAAYTVFQDTYKRIYDKSFPLVNRSANHHIKAKQPWMTKALLKSCKRKSKLHKKYLMNPTAVNKQKFNSYRNIFKSLRIESERQYYADRFTQCNHNIKKTWAIIKQILNPNSHLSGPELFLIDGKETDKNHVIADAFNKYFTNIGPTLASNIPKTSLEFKHFMPNPPPCSFGILPVNDEELIQVANDLKTTNSSGPDGINPSIAKLSINSIAGTLTTIFNSSFSYGLVPSELKIAKVTPIFKSGEKNLINNYRPISILPFFSKIMEKLMYNRLLNFLDKFNLLAHNQYGFRKNHSTFMALMDIQCNISEAMNNNHYSIGIFFDLSKAFDTVDHNILITKLNSYGIRGIVNHWFSDYLSGRTQFVTFKDSLSHCSDITWGVPQGSILGPLLFLLYVNDLSSLSSLFKLVLFADDTNAFLNDISVTNLFHKANCELELISLWFRTNKLSLNLNKTNYIVFYSKRKIPPPPTLAIIIDGLCINQVTSTKFLGIVIDTHLNWKDHILQISKKMAKNIGILRRMRHYLPSNILINLYYTFIFPYLSYCNISWGVNYTRTINCLVVLQKLAIRTVFHVQWGISTKPTFKVNNLLTILDINRLQIGLFMYRYHHKLLPPSFNNYFKLGSSVHHHFTRTALNYRTDFARINPKRFSIKCQGPLVWNSLPSELTSLPTISRFKQALKMYLINLNDECCL